MSGSSITLTPEETRQFGQLFREFDTDGSGVVLGEAARPLFERSGLEPKVLGQIWSYADTENRGFLDFQGFSKALRVMSHVQQGHTLSGRLVTIPASPPHFRKTSTSGSAPTSPAIAQGVPSAPSSRVASKDLNHRVLPNQGTGQSELVEPHIPAISPADKQRFDPLFDKSAHNGLLDGGAAREIFIKARLPTETLGAIWNLVDVQGRGSLTRNEFLVAMHLIQSTINGSLSSIPQTLPQSWKSWLDSGDADTPVSPRSRTQPGSISGPSASIAPASATASANPIEPKTTGPTTYAITPQQRVQFDGYFDELDTAKAGKIGAQEVAPFLTKSNLSEETLAQIWDLADYDGQGQFGKSEFALAMYFVQLQLSGGQLPETLPPNLLASVKAPQSVASPPGSDSAQYATAAAPALGVANVPSRGVTSPPPPRQALTQQSTASSLTDLAGLDDAFFRPKDAAKTRNESIASMDALKASRGIQATSTPGTAQPQTNAQGSSSEGKRDLQFVPLSSFGQSLVGQSAAETQSANNEVQGLQRQLEELKTEHSTAAISGKQADEELASILEQKKNLEAQIRGLRERYDSEATKVHKTQERIKTTKDEIKQLEKSHTLRESGLKALQSQYDQDKAELNGLLDHKEKLTSQISSFEEQHSTHKSNLDSLQSESAHLRGQVDNHTTQISSMEAELQSIYEQIEGAKAHRDETSKKAREAKDRAERLAAEVVTAQQEHNDILASTQRHEAALAEANRAIESGSINAVPSGSRSVGSAAPVGAAAVGAIGGGAIAAAGAAALAGRHYAAGSPTSTQQNSTIYSPHSSPPTSEFPAAYGDQQQQIPSFTLPMERPESATSSVANNPPQSVRGDVDVSQPESPAFSTSEPVSGLVPPETLNLPASSEELAKAAEPSDNDSFEFVDAYDGQETGAASSTGAGNSIAAEELRDSQTGPVGPSTQPSFDKEFPPIQELQVDEDSSDDEKVQHSLSQETAANAEEPVAHNSSSARALENSQTTRAQTATVPRPTAGPSDDFGDAFDDLQDAQDDDFASGDESEAFQEVPLAGTSGAKFAPPPEFNLGTGTPKLDQIQGEFSGPDEWQQLFQSSGAPSAPVAPAAFPGAGTASKVMAPEDAALGELTAMGFDRDAALDALKRSKFNVSEATNLLLDA